MSKFSLFRFTKFLWLACDGHFFREFSVCLVSEDLICYYRLYLAFVKFWWRWPFWWSCIILVSVCAWVIGPFVVVMTWTSCNLRCLGFSTILVWLNYLNIRWVPSLRPLPQSWCRTLRGLYYTRFFVLFVPWDLILLPTIQGVDVGGCLSNNRLRSWL